MLFLIYYKCVVVEINNKNSPTNIISGGRKMTQKEQILKMIEEEIASYEEVYAKADAEHEEKKASKAWAKTLALGKLRNRINEEVE